MGLSVGVRRKGSLGWEQGKEDTFKGEQVSSSGKAGLVVMAMVIQGTEVAILSMSGF